MKIKGIGNQGNILAEAKRIVDEITQNNNWSSLTGLLASKLLKGISRPLDILAKDQYADQENRRIIAKVRENLLEQKILVFKYEGRSYDILNASGLENDSRNSSCLSLMNFDLGSISKQGLGINNLHGRELGFATFANAESFAEAFKLSYKKTFGDDVKIKICEMFVMRDL